MDALAAVDHLLNFIAPALFVALLLALPAVRRGDTAAAAGGGAALARFGRAFGCLALVGSVALTLCLVLFGRDGRIASYAALVLASGTTQWLLRRGWRR